MADEVYHGGNAFSGLQSKVHVDENDGKIHIEHIGDVEPVLERNKSILNGHGGWLCDRTGEGQGGMRHVATIPPLMIVKLKDMGIDIFSQDPDQQRLLTQVLNSNEYRHLRTTPGKI